MDKYTFYTDGAATMKKINGEYVREAGGWGFVMLIDGKLIDETNGGAPLTTNNAMELYAILAALRHFNSFGETGKTIEICSDSAYCINIFTQWITNWKNNGWTRGKKHEPIENLAIIKEIDKAISEVNRRFNNIIWTKVKGHSTDKYNNMVDAIAVNGKIAAMSNGEIRGYRWEEDPLLK